VRVVDVVERENDARHGGEYVAQQKIPLVIVAVDYLAVDKRPILTQYQHKVCNLSHDAKGNCHEEKIASALGRSGVSLFILGGNHLAQVQSADIGYSQRERGYLHVVEGNRDGYVGEEYGERLQEHYQGEVVVEKGVSQVKETGRHPKYYKCEHQVE